LSCDSLVLGVETSCDETAAAVARGGREILSSVVASQDDLHAHFGGIVPEVASRRHAELVTAVVQQALEQAEIGWEDLSLIAVTRGPGLVGSLLVGVSAAKGYSLATGLPLVGVDHIAAHVHSCFIRPAGSRTGALTCLAPEQFPFICLVASGGHSDLVLTRGLGEYELVGWTRDDAAGEALDKAARLLGLGYPGGPAIERAAEQGDPGAVELPRPDIGDEFGFSFAGLKTALVRIVDAQCDGGGQRRGESEQELRPTSTTADLAASFQQAVVDTLVRETVQAAGHFRVRQILLAGGVAANRTLRDTMSAAAEQRGIAFHVPPRWLCTDNAAMVAGAGFHQAAQQGPDDLRMEVESALRLPVREEKEPP
jgi:N6-L-threonylcarbamoyladenine synthase